MTTKKIIFPLSDHRTLGGPGEGECVRSMTLPRLDDLSRNRRLFLFAEKLACWGCKLLLDLLNFSEGSSVGVHSPNFSFRWSVSVTY